MSFEETEPLLHGVPDPTTVRLPEREGMLEKRHREEQARWDEEDLAKGRAKVCRLLQEIIDQEKELRKESQGENTIREDWKKEILGLMDKTPGHPFFNYHWAHDLKKHLENIERALRDTKTHPLISRRSGKVRPGYTARELVSELRLQPVREYRLTQIWIRLTSIGSRLSNGGSHIERYPVHQDFKPLWSNVIFYAITHTKGFSVLSDDCYFQAIAVLSKMHTESCSCSDQLAFFRDRPAENVLKLMGLDLIELPPYEPPQTEKIKDRVRNLFKHGSFSSTNPSLSHKIMSRRQLGIYGF